MTFEFLTANNASTTIAQDIDPSATTILLAPGTGQKFPAPTAGKIVVCTLYNSTFTLNEIVNVTARVGDTVTVVRGQENTTPIPWAKGVYFKQLWTDAQAQDVVQWPQMVPALNKEPAIPNYSAIGFGAKTTPTAVVGTDYTASLQLAIDMAVSSGSTMYFPPGYIYCAGNLRNFHNVKKVGPGAVYTGPAIIGTGVFWIEGVVTNNLFATASGGDDTNDGLTSSRPLASPQGCLSYANLYSADRSWTFNFTGGTYTIPASMSYNSINMTGNTVRFIGTANTVGGQPSTIFKGPDNTTRTLRFLTSTLGTNFQIQNVFFQNMGSVNAASQTGRMTLTNCWCTNVQQMISLGNNGFCTASYGVWDFRDTNGVIITDSIGAGAVIGSCYNYDQGTLGNLGLIIQFADRGLVTNELGSGHEDAVRVFDCNIGQEFTRTFGAANLTGTIYNRCKIGILVRGPGMMLVSNTQDFGTGADACLQDIVYTDAPTNAQIEDTNYDTRRGWQNRSYSIATTIVPDGTAKNFFATAGSIVKRRPRIGDTVRFFITGRFVGALSVAAAVNLNLNGTPILASNLPFPVGTVEWVIEANFMVINNFDINNPTTAQQVRGIIEIRAYDGNAVGLPSAGKRSTTANLLSVTGNTAMNWTITENSGGQNFQFAECTINSTVGGFTYP